MTNPTAQLIVSFLEENRPVECTFCQATLAFQNKKTGEMVCTGVSGCGCLARIISEAPHSPQDLGKEATPKNEEDYVGRGNKQQELEDPMKELKLREEKDLKNAREQEETLVKEKEEEAAQKQREQEEALEKQRKEVESLRKQKIEEDASRKLKEEEARKKLEEEEAKAVSMQHAEAEMNQSRKTWIAMKYSPNLKSDAIVYIVFRWTPIDFQIVCEDDIDLLQMLQDDMLERVTSGNLKKINGVPQQDDVVIAEYDGAFYRARVSNPTSGKCQLSFIDYGDIAFKKNEEIYEIPEDLYKTPIYGLKVRLDGLDVTDFNAKALLSDTVDPSLLETAYSLKLMQQVDTKDMYTRGILREVKTGHTLNDAVKKNLRNL